MKECSHCTDVQGVKFCANTAGGKDTLVCEFPGWEGDECPFDMLEAGKITPRGFYDLWLKAISINLQTKV